MVSAAKDDVVHAVTGEVAEAIDGALPSLVRIFTGSDNIVVFEPQTASR